jgi:hypothetical protein
MDHWSDRIVACCRPPYSIRFRYWRRTRSVVTDPHDRVPSPLRTERD